MKNIKTGGSMFRDVLCCIKQYIGTRISTHNFDKKEINVFLSTAIEFKFLMFQIFV